MFRVRIDTDTTFNGRRITTVVVRYPWIIHHKLLGYRAFCQNILVPPSIETVKDDPFVPLDWGSANASVCQIQWQQALDANLVHAQQMVEHCRLDPEQFEPLLAPFAYITCIITATEWANFFNRRLHDDSDTYLLKLATMLRDAIQASTPLERPLHMPYLTPPEQYALLENYMQHGIYAENVAKRAMVSVSRCARGTFTVKNRRVKTARDVETVATMTPGYWSPFEHFAVSYVGTTSGCPYKHWKHFRAYQLNENLPGHIGEYLCLKK